MIAKMKDQRFEVTERYYSDVTRNEPNTRYKSTKNTYRGDHLVSSESSIHESGGVYKYLDVRHDRNVESCKCPYCLQVYKQTGVIINDDLDRRNVYTLAHTPRCTDQEPIILTEPLRFVYKSFRELPFLNFSWYYSPTGQ